MRKRRILGLGKSYYHCVNRIIERRFLLGDEEKEFFVKLMRKVEGFSGVRVLSYCVMDNHFHLLLEVAEAPGVISEEEVLERMAFLYTKRQIKEFRVLLAQHRKLGMEDLAQKELDRFRRRMFSLEQFMKTLGQRFTFWYNRKHGRCGPLWNDRYKSVLIEAPAHYEPPTHAGESTLFAMAAYIDLNPIRAGMVEDPKDYRWCSYAKAVAGGELARSGIISVLEARGYGLECRGGKGRSRRIRDGRSGLKEESRRIRDGRSGVMQEGLTWRGASRIYRRQLFAIGEEASANEAGQGARKGISRDEVDAVAEKDGELCMAELLHCRIRYFSEGAVIGSRAFVEEVYGRVKDDLGLKRDVGARKMKRGQWGEWCSLRDLRGEVVLE